MENGRRPRILVVDDDRNSRIAVRAVLDALNVEVVEVESGEEALKSVLRMDFAMIILDIRLKGMNGFETAAIIRERETSRDVPIIFLTGYEREEIKINLGYDLGAVDYMLKPIIPDSLRAKVRYHVRLLRSLEKEKAATRNLSDLVEELNRSNKALDEFAYIASHDLKEPLRGITINANFMLKEELPENVRKRAARMIELSVHMEKLISDLLFLSRLSQKGDPNLTSDVAEIVDGCSNLVEDLQDPSCASLVVHDNFPVVFGDPAHIRTVFQNLISNGLQYNRSEPKKIEVGFAKFMKFEDMVQTNVFYVKDNGIGISPEFHEKIFNVFTRLNAREDYSGSLSGSAGSGAGLSFVKRIVEGYGGSIGVDSALGKGAVFYFTLPLTKRQKPY